MTYFDEGSGNYTVMNQNELNNNNKWSLVSNKDKYEKFNRDDW